MTRVDSPVKIFEIKKSPWDCLKLNSFIQIHKNQKPIEISLINKYVETETWDSIFVI